MGGLRVGKCSSDLLDRGRTGSFLDVPCDDSPCRRDRRIRDDAWMRTGLSPRTPMALSRSGPRDGVARPARRRCRAPWRTCRSRGRAWFGFSIFAASRAASSSARVRASAFARALPHTSKQKNSMPPCARSIASRSCSAPPAATRLSGSTPPASTPAPPDFACARPRRDEHLDVGLDAHLQRVHRRLVAGLIAVVEQHDPLGQPLERRRPARA